MTPAARRGRGGWGARSRGREWCGRSAASHGPAAAFAGEGGAAPASSPRKKIRSRRRPTPARRTNGPEAPGASSRYTVFGARADEVGRVPRAPGSGACERPRGVERRHLCGNAEPSSTFRWASTRLYHGGMKAHSDTLTSTVGSVTPSPPIGPFGLPLERALDWANTINILALVLVAVAGAVVAVCTFLILRWQGEQDHYK